MIILCTVPVFFFGIALWLRFINYFYGSNSCMIDSNVPCSIAIKSYR